NSFSYEQLFQTMRELKLTYQDMEQMYRRMVFNVIARNCDDHTKNFAFRLKKDQAWELATAYDVCHAYRPGSEWVSQHALSINNKRKDITRADLLTIGDLIASKKAAVIIDEINDTVAQWNTFAKAVDVDTKLRNSIAKTFWLMGD
ncbi:MAG: type II toxin-antitoxin system HipA family toxin, partial [Bacteroidia bacterium]